MSWALVNTRTSPPGPSTPGIAGCGAARLLRQHEEFVFDPRSLEHEGVVLFDRAKDLPPAE